MNEENKVLNDEDLEQVTGGGGESLPWGPFDDCVVNCPNCNVLQIIYKGDYPWSCRDCGVTMWFN